MLFARLYMRVGILLTCSKHMYDYIISPRGEVWGHKTSFTLPLFFNWLYQARKVSGDVFV